MTWAGTATGAPAARLRELVSLAVPWAIRVAVTLRLPDMIASGVSSVEEIARDCRADTDSVERLLELLRSVGIFDRTPAGWQRNEMSRLLESGTPLKLTGSLDLGSSFNGKQAQIWANLLYTVRSGRPAWEQWFGTPFWEDLKDDDDLGRAFRAGMAGFSDMVPRLLATSYDWGAAQRVVDVGGGTGRNLTALLTAHPDLRGTLFDMPESCAEAGDRLTAAGLADRSSVVAGSFLREPLPSGADVYLLSFVLHDWPDEETAHILNACARAARPGGRVLVVERLVATDGPEHNRHYNAYADLLMMITLGGKERTLAQLCALGDQAGLRFVAEHRLPDGPPLALVEFEAGRTTSRL